MSKYRPIRDITLGNARLLSDVDPDLVVLNTDAKSHMPICATASKIASAAVTDEILKNTLSVNFGSNLLEETGWGDGLRLPFANKENHELEKILEVRQRKFMLVQTELRNNQEHLSMLEEHFTRASEDIVTYQNFLASKRKQIEEEKGLLSLSERFFCKVKQERLKTLKLLGECKERCVRMQRSHDSRLTNLYELRDLIEFDREALKEYHERLRLYKNEKLELGRIIQEDSRIVEDIDIKYVELGARTKVLKMELDQEAMTTSKCQEQLDRLSVEFRKVYRHRQEMITLWSANIENAKRKDAQMQDVADDYFDTREKMRDLNSEIQFRERQYKSVECGIRGARISLSDLDKKTVEHRRILQNYKEIARQLSDSIIELQQDIRSSALEEKRLHAAYAKLDAEINSLYGKLEKIGGVVDKLKSKLEEVLNLRQNSDQNINELEVILDDEVKKGENILREMDFTRKHFWERSNDHKDLSTALLHLNMNIQRHKSNLANLEAKEYIHMEYLSRQSSKVYRMDLECSTLENKLSRVENASVNPHYYILQGELTQLHEVEKRLSEEKKYISNELMHLERLITKNGTELAKNKEQREKYSTELLEINMVSQRTQKLTDQADKEFQSLQVENSLESVNLKRLNDAVKLAKEQLFGLSEERKTIYWAVNERKTEIENNRILNVNKSKALQEAVSKLKVQIQEMDGRTSKLKGRFELVTKLMVDSKSAGNDEETIADKVRKAARERESLQLEYRKWEKRVEEAQQELVGLENVQKLLHSSNLAVKDKLMPIREGSMELQELELLDHEEKAIYVRKRRALRFKGLLFDKIEDLKERMAVKEQEAQATAQLSKMKAAVASKVENELERGKEKVQRWNLICTKLLKEIKPTFPTSDYDILQRDLRLKFIQEKLECAMNMLERLLNACPDHRQWVCSYFENDQNLNDYSNRVRRSHMEVSTSAQKAVRRRTYQSKRESRSHRASAKNIDSRKSLSRKQSEATDGSKFMIDDEIEVSPSFGSGFTDDDNDVASTASTPM